MKYITFLSSTVSLFTVPMSPIVWLFVLCVAVAAAMLIHAAYTKNRQRKRDGKRIDNVYFVGVPKNTEIDLPFGDDQFGSQLVYFAEMGKVAALAEKVMRRIKDSGNQRKVVPVFFYYQDADNINEDLGEYRDRVIDGVKEDRALKHATISVTDRKYYIEEQHGDRQFEWSQE